MSLPRGVKDATGEVYGRLTVLGYAHTEKRRTYWRVRCDCGIEKILKLNAMRTGNTQSCGCLVLESRTSHGLSQHPLYPLWSLMMARCYNKKDRSFPAYGGRGIRVAKRWHDVANFIADMPPRPEDSQLERSKNHLGYSKNNCRWVTPKENSRNKRNTVHVMYEGTKVSLAQLAEDHGIPYTTAHGRVKKGLDPITYQRRRRS